MADPWDKYAQQAETTAGPWAKYGTESTAPTSAPTATRHDLPPGVPPTTPDGRSVMMVDGVPSVKDGNRVRPVFKEDLLAVPMPPPADDALSSLSTAYKRATQPQEVDPLLDAITAAPDGLRQGVSNLIGFLPDLGIHAINNAPRLLNILPGVQDVGPMSDDPVTVTDNVDWLFRGGGAVPDYEPQTGWGKATGRVSEEIGAAMVPGSAAVKAAEKMGKTGISAMRDFNWRDVASYLPGIVKPTLRAAEANPKAFIGQEVGVSAGAGLGAAGLNELTGNEDRENPWIDAAGALSGATLTGLGTVLLPRIGDMFSALGGSPKYTSGYVKDAVASQIAGNSDIVARGVDPADIGAPMDTDALVAAIRSTAPTAETIPGFKPTTADVAGDFGLANLETARASGGNNAGLYRTRTSDNAAAVDDALAAVAPTQPAARFTEELDLERNRRMTDAEIAALVSQNEADAATAPFAVNTTRPERGGAIREGLETQRDAARQRTADAYAKSGVGEVPIDPVAVRSRIDEAVDGLTQVRQGLLPEETIERVRRLGAEGDGPAPTGLLDASGNPIMRAAAPAEPVPMDEVMSLRDELTRLQRAALSDPRAERGGRNASEAIGRVVSAIDGYIDDTLPDDLRIALNEARQTKFDEVEAFGRRGDPLAEALASREGRPIMREDRVASTFTNPENIDRLFAAAPTDEVRKAVKEEILSRGDFSTAAGATKFKEQYGEQLKRFPGLAAEVEKAAAARLASETARQSSADLAKGIGPEGTGTVAKYLRYGDERAERAMARLVDQPDAVKQVDELLTFVGDDPQSVEGARKAFWEVMETKGRAQNAGAVTESGVMPWVSNRWRKFMDDGGIKAVAERLYRDNPEHWEAVQNIEASLRGLADRKTGASARNPSGTFTSQKGAAVSLAEVQSKYYEVARGRVNPAYMITYLGTRIMNRIVGKKSEMAFQKLLDTALLEPEVAAKLLSENNPANRAALRRMAKAWLGNNAANLLDGIFDEEDPVLEAVGAN